MRSVPNARDKLKVADVVVSTNHVTFLTNKFPRLISLPTSAIFVSGISCITAILKYRGCKSYNSNILHELGNSGHLIFDRKISRNITPKICGKIINDGIKLILNNSFQFDNKNYIQTRETAMRTKILSTYPALTLAFFEENLYEIIGKNVAII